MAVKIRLKRLGKIRNPQYRIVVMDARQKRDGRAIEEIGIYQPRLDPSLIQVNSERAQYWLGVGAQPTEAVVAIFKRSGDWQKFSGDDSPSGIDPQKPRPDRVARYNAAVSVVTVADDAVKLKRTPRKQAEAEEAVDEAIAAIHAGKAADEPEATEETED